MTRSPSFIPKVSFRLNRLVVNGSESSDGSGQATWQQFGCLSVVLWFGSQQTDYVLQGAGRLQAESVHHIAEIVWRKEWCI